jgi:hypothetical protein
VLADKIMFLVLSVLCYVLLTRYHSGDQVKKIEVGRTCGTYGERRVAYRALVGKFEGRRPLGRPRRRWEDNIKMNLREVGWGHGLDQSGSG